MILPVNLRPSGSGTSTMSRGTDTIETVWATGSSEAMIIVSVRYVLRPTPASTPTSRTLTRGTVGVADGDGLAEALGLGTGVARKLGSGSGVPSGPASAVGDGSVKISSAVSLATSVA